MNIRTLTRRLRQLSQILFLLLFLFLFRNTDYTGSDTIPYAVNIFFRWDPLVAAAVWLATKEIVTLLLPSLFVVALTLVFARAFCGWICPLGTLIDGAGFFIKPVVKKRLHLRYIKYLILFTVLVSALLGVQWLAFVDPFSLLVRGLSFSVDPAFNAIVTGFFDTIYMSGPSWLSGLTEPIYDIFKAYVLPYKQSFFYLAMLSFIILGAVFLMELISKRFWCRNLCPLGAMLALISKFSLFKRLPLSACRKCEMCIEKCRMDAFSPENRIHTEECNLCMDCLEYCDKKISRFAFSAKPSKQQIDLSKRQLVASGAAGVVLWSLTRVDAAAKSPSSSVIRPPGALNETEFLASCVRCGECMKVCIRNALQPVFMETGIEGMFTPKLVPRLGYCEFNCTLCGQVCPTGALENLSLEKKHAFVIGKAYVDKNRCLPYASGKPCIVCEEHCPTHDKAIKFKTVTSEDQTGNRVELKQPYIIDSLCIGCGICENMCPVTGNSAIRVTAEDKTPMGMQW